MSACFACYWPAIFVPYVPRGRTLGRAGVGVYRGGGEEEKSCYNFKSIIPGSQPLHKVLLWKDWTRLSSILSLPHCLGQVQLSALPRIASWCDGPHKDEPIKNWQVFWNKTRFQMERLIGAVLPAFFNSIPVKFERTSCYYLTRKLFADIIHLLEKEGIT